MDLVTRIARTERADRINELYKRCHAKFIQAHYAWRLAHDRMEQINTKHPEWKSLDDVRHRASSAMRTLNNRSMRLARAYVATIVPSGVRNA